MFYQNQQSYLHSPSQIKEDFGERESEWLIIGRRFCLFLVKLSIEVTELMGSEVKLVGGTMLGGLMSMVLRISCHMLEDLTGSLTPLGLELTNVQSVS